MQVLEKYKETSMFRVKALRREVSSFPNGWSSLEMSKFSLYFSGSCIPNAPINVNPQREGGAYVGHLMF